jgi:hypothetical protein
MGIYSFRIGKLPILGIFFFFKIFKSRITRTDSLNYLKNLKKTLVLLVSEKGLSTGPMVICDLRPRLVGQGNKEKDLSTGPSGR